MNKRGAGGGGASNRSGRGGGRGKSSNIITQNIAGCVKKVETFSESFTSYLVTESWMAKTNLKIP